MPENETIVAFADQALDFVQQTVSVYTVSWLWTQLSRASRQHWEKLATYDPARNDVRVVLSTVCNVTTESHYLSRWEPPQIPGEPAEAVLALPEGSPGICSKGAAARGERCALAPPISGSTCLVAAGNRTAMEQLPVMIIAAHAMGDVYPKFGTYMSLVWQDLCRHCQFICARRSNGAPYALGEVHVVLDEHMSLPLTQLESLPYRLVVYSWDPGKMGRFFHYNGNLLEAIGATENLVAQASRNPATCMSVRVNQEMRNGGGFIYNWRKVLAHLGFTKQAINKVVQNEISKYEANWTRDLAAHMMTYKAG